MGQQPNIELEGSDLPRKEPEPAPARRWRPTKPGLIVSPDEKPGGGYFGTTGPDPGWALRLIGDYELPNDDPDLRSVVAGLTIARAAALGRAAVKKDIEAALVLCGFGEGAPQYLVERRERWLAAAPHEQRPGRSAVAEVDRDLLTKSPDQIRYAVRHAAEAKPDSHDD